ncbi:hypothetical protein AAFN86_27810, partial [Roseomonas sp. CAU 1739]
MRRVEVLDQDEGRAIPGRQRIQESPASVEAAGRSADADNREGIRVSAQRRRLPRSRLRRIQV